MGRAILIVFIVLILIFCGKKKSAPFTVIAKINNESFLLPVQKLELKKEVPVLCYHNFTESQNTEITLSRSRFEKQVKMLADSGYRSISPDDLFAYLTKNKAVPPKPIIFSFDDTRKTQFTIAEPILKKYGFRGVFFIMTVCIGKPGYMTADDLKELVHNGHSIAAHTYNHPLLSRMPETDWNNQLIKPKERLEHIVGNDINYFAYPNGIWTNKAISQVKLAGYKAAFQLSESLNANEPLFTIRRMMVQGHWTEKELLKHIVVTFH